MPIHQEELESIFMGHSDDDANDCIKINTMFGRNLGEIRTIIPNSYYLYLVER